MTPEAPGGVPLLELEVGARARLHATRLDSQTRSLLRALGLTDGSPLRVCKRGEPVILQVRATRIGISRVVAAGLYVRPSDLAATTDGEHGDHGARR